MRHRPAGPPSRHRAVTVAALLAGAIAARPTGAQQPAAPGPATTPPAAPAATPAPVLRAARVAGSIRLDGRLDEAAWRAAEAAGGFVQQYPKDRAPASERTEARVLYDGQAIYVGVRAYDREPRRIAAQLARRDASNIYSDWVHVALDSYHDRRTAFRFSVNPRGVQKDVRHFDDGNEDLLWDAVWEVATAVDADGWTAEYRIPLSQLRYASGAPRAGAPGTGAAAAGDSAGGGRRWGLQVSRDIARLQERDNWAPIAQNVNGYVSRFGDLTGLDGLATPRRVELVPYASSRVERAPGDPANPFYRRTAARPSVGGDFRLGVTTGLTLTGTVNPDFGQVELDPAFVNLTAFEVFLPERRPFFIEGGEIFNFGGLAADNTIGTAQLFYSRRLGRAPQRSAFAADEFGRRPTYADAPTQTAILGAAKLSGKTAGGWSIGVLDAVTAGEEARLLQRVAPAGAGPGAAPLELRRATPVEPRSNYFVARTRRDFRAGATVVGAALTNVARALSARDQPYDVALGRAVDGAEVFRPMLAAGATVGGVDFEHNWHQRDWTLSGHVTGSRVAGSRTMITALQRAPYRLLQRPDGRHGVDSAATALGGYAAGLALAKRGGNTWGSLAYQEFSRGFEVNDVGFGQTTDQRAASWVVGRQNNQPTGRMARLRRYNGYVYGNHVYDLDGLSVFQGYGAGANAQHARTLWNVNLNGGYQPAAYDNRLLRGGPVARKPASWRFNPYVGTDARRPVVLGMYAFVRNTDIGGRERSAGVDASMRPRTNLSVSLGPSLRVARDPAQYVQRVADPLAAATYGARYVFATVDQTTVSMLTRVNWTFTPRLSLETVLQPFVSAGRFGDYKEFAAPGRSDFRVYGRDGASTLARDSAGALRADPDGAGPAPAFRVGDQSFTVRTLRGSAVARWEFRPGSTLFLVWQQQRSGSLADGRLDGRRDLGGLFREPAQNVFLVKATYWLSR